MAATIQPVQLSMLACASPRAQRELKNSRYRQYERGARMLRSSPIPGALWDRAVATLSPVWRLRVREMCIPRGPPARRGYRR